MSIKTSADCGIQVAVPEPLAVGAWYQRRLWQGYGSSIEPIYKWFECMSYPEQTYCARCHTNRVFAPFQVAW